MGHLAFASVSANSGERKCERSSRLLANVIPFLTSYIKKKAEFACKRERGTKNGSDEVNVMSHSQQPCLFQRTQNAIFSLVVKNQVSQSTSGGTVKERTFRQIRFYFYKPPRILNQKCTSRTLNYYNNSE